MTAEPYRRDDVRDRESWRRAPTRLGSLACQDGFARQGGTVCVDAGAELDASLARLLDDGERVRVEQLGGLREADPPLAEQLEDTGKSNDPEARAVRVRFSERREVRTYVFASAA